MPRKKKNESIPAPGSNAPGESAAVAAPTTSAKKTGPVRKVATTGAKKKSRAVRPGVGKRSSATPKIAEPSDTDIRLRAYFIAERRLQLALQGDPANDWIEARRQLLEEARQAQP